eukprot:313181_1
MSTDGGEQQMQQLNTSTNPSDSEPLLLVTSAIVITNHNDSQLLTQQTVVNLNNPNVRLTIWCIVYMILSGLATQSGTAGYIWFNDDISTTWNPSIYEDMATYWSLYASANAILFCAAFLFLLTLYCLCIKLM